MQHIRIADLARPALSQAQQRVVREAERNPVPLTEGAVLDAAARATGLRNFGHTDFLERLGVWLRAGIEDEGLSAFGRKVLFDYCVRYASNRLELEDRISRNREILEERIERPVFIGGLPRSGTTNLVNLMASDPRWRSLPYWEAVRPFPPLEQVSTSASTDPRYTRCLQEWEQLDALLPHLKAMHEMSPDHIHEDLELQALDFTTYNIEWTAHVPRWRDWYLAHDRTVHYSYLRKAVQALQWQDRRMGLPPRRWLLKCPQHLENLRPLVETFPDATVVLTHRDPVEVIQSAVTTIAYGDRVRRRRIDLEATTDYWIDRVDRLLRACVRDRERLSSGCSLDLMFPEYMADEFRAIEQVYELAGMKRSDDARAAILRHRTEHPPGAQGRVRYDFQSDFGRRPEEVRLRFSYYLSRWPEIMGR
jgi:hypothetical protein